MQPRNEAPAMLIRQTINLLDLPVLNENEATALYAGGSKNKWRKMVAAKDAPLPNAYGLYKHDEIKEKFGSKRPHKFRINEDNDLSIFNAWAKDNGKD